MRTIPETIHLAARVADPDVPAVPPPNAAVRLTCVSVRAAAYRPLVGSDRKRNAILQTLGILRDVVDFHKSMASPHVEEAERFIEEVDDQIIVQLSLGNYHRLIPGKPSNHPIHLSRVRCPAAGELVVIVVKNIYLHVESSSVVGVVGPVDLDGDPLLDVSSARSTWGKLWGLC